jgi:hypothetical protein
VGASAESRITGLAVSRLVQTQATGLSVVFSQENHTSRALSGHSNCESAFSRVRSVRSLDRAVLTTWKTPNHRTPACGQITRALDDKRDVRQSVARRRRYRPVCHQTRPKRPGSASRHMGSGLLALLALFFRKDSLPAHRSIRFRSCPVQADSEADSPISLG